MLADALRATSSYNATSGLTGIAREAGALVNAVTDNAGTGRVNFSDLLSESLSSARAAIQKGETLSAKSLMQDTNLVDVVTAITEADTTLQTIITIRDKVIAAYQDILKMPI